jgi:hypothetical protein
MALSFMPYFEEEGRMTDYEINSFAIIISKQEQCIYCIKEKYVKKIKKDTKRSA